MDLYTELTTKFPDMAFKQEQPLAAYSQVKIGGPAEVFIEVKQKDNLVKLIQYCLANQLEFHVLGWGANTLIADRGLRGLVIKNAAQKIEVLPTEVAASKVNKTNQKVQQQISKNAGRWQQLQETTHVDPQFAELEKLEQTATRVLVNIDAGTPLPAAINKLIAQDISGLQWFAKIPATLGGAIYNNIHGGNHLIGEFVQLVEILDEQGQLKTLTNAELELDYDYSRFHHTNEVIIAAKLLLYQIETTAAQQFAINWSREKAHQPQKSLGCVFQNLDQATAQQLNLPTTSAGYLIDQELGLKGFAIGDAEVSSDHAAFIVNNGHATAADYLAVIKQIQQATQQKFDIHLKPEIFFLGFTDQELAGIIPQSKK